MSETIADIVKEMRLGVKDWRGRRIGIFDCFADRIEEAWKRERERGAEAAQICGEVGEEIGRESNGNAAKMREAIEAVSKVGYPHNFQREPYHIRTFCYEITDAIAKCLEAIHEPKRNCDRFATAKEAREAWFALDNHSDDSLGPFEWMYSTVAK